jgi:predicted anti-sigma-YlaC factor YlaD
MNCNECEEKVFTYKELSDDERVQVNAHLQECIDCGKLMDQVKELNYIILKAKASTPLPKNASALTQRIMESLPRVERTFWQLIIESFNNTWLQYSLRIASMVLVVFFVFETVQNPMQLTKALVHQSKIELNSSAFVRRYQQNRTSPKTITYFARYQKIKQSGI